MRTEESIREKLKVMKEYNSKSKEQLETQIIRNDNYLYNIIMDSTRKYQLQIDLLEWVLKIK